MRTIITLFIAVFSLSVLANNQVNERIQFLDKVFELLETNVANPAWLESEAYAGFKTKMYDRNTLQLSETDFYSTFQEERKALPFTHFYLLPRKNATSSIDAPKKERQLLSWKEMNAHTAYLDVRSFSGGAEQMMKAIGEIGIDTYDNLIIDLRDNGGGTLDAPVILGQFLTNKPIDAGVYLTRKWFETEARSAEVEDINDFPFLQDFTYSGITKMFQENAAFRMVLPGHNRSVYQGNVYVLVNGNTASACEPLIHVLKQYEVGTLVGECSAGAMLSAYTFEVNENYDVFIPIADFQMADGARIDKVGVTPTIEVDQDNALEYVLSELIAK